MKFLVWVKPSATITPQPEQMASLTRAFSDTLREQLNSHKLDCAYTCGQGEGFGIMDAPTLEEAWERTYQNPMAMFWEIDIQALADPIAVAGAQLRLIESSQRAAAGVR